MSRAMQERKNFVFAPKTKSERPEYSPKNTWGVSCRPCSFVSGVCVRSYICVAVFVLLAVCSFSLYCQHSIQFCGPQNL